MAGIYRASAAASSLGRLLGASRARSFGTSAALRLEYESDEEWEVGGGGKANACGEAEGRGVQWVFMGGPSAQKHVYATRIAALLGVPYISMGGLVRRELHPRSSLYKKIANAVNEGKLVPEDIIFGLLSQRLEEGYYRGERGFILGGIPRTRMQAEILDQITDIDLVVNLKCTEDCLVKKHLGSGICSHCGMSPNNGSSEATTSSSCFATTMQHSQLKSADGMDAGEIQSQKFQTYAEQSKLLEDYYWKQRKLLNFQVAGGPGETWQGLLVALHLQHIDAVKSSSILTA